ncbi:TetR family transcriptional regulator [Aeromicrobium sp. 636]|uniref:TetR/AcrR family transcriptional regulator n=1 Tax=Aeromicrobium senzhongii TaxID=2663859 RepID=A0A8I0EX74_9ACTN|nr:TetR/AcrR family transcriptional regulator [Aeromicrobium senzhongii]MCQ3999123.1 TetR family transcriptional regulator [Aeromicrobium sp. 636]MTB89375.1 TetR family transcriptional regulator [Aeromicrobium senzhongii]QNL94476.1 TetR/AcrR family transcriptional regulator [Aeromicrobium senzhongii]
MVSRRDQILDTAAGLFAARGYHGVSVHDIGEACGISGPAIYKHFTGKEDLLAQSLTSISEQLLAGGRQRRSEATGPEAALDALIAWHVEFALTHPALIVVQDREWANLSIDAQQTVRELQLSYIDAWVDTLRELRPNLDRATARAATQAVFGLINSTPHSARISPEAMSELLVSMARAGVLATGV